MSNDVPKKLTKAFNKNVGGIVTGLVELKNQPGSKFDFEIVAGKEPFAKDGVFIKTNIPTGSGQTQMLAILINTAGIRAYDHMKFGGKDEGIGATVFKQSLEGGEADASSVKDVLAAVKKRAATKGLITGA